MRSGCEPDHIDLAVPCLRTNHHPAHHPSDPTNLFTSHRRWKAHGKNLRKFAQGVDIYGNVYILGDMNNTETNSPIATVRNMLTGRTNQQLSEMLTLLADNENTTESRIVEAAICEVIIDRKPEFTDILDAWSEDYTSEVTMRELAINFLNN